MTTSKQKRARAIAKKTGVSYQEAINLLNRGALSTEVEATEVEATEVEPTAVEVLTPETTEVLELPPGKARIRLAHTQPDPEIDPKARGHFREATTEEEFIYDIYTGEGLPAEIVEVGGFYTVDLTTPESRACFALGQNKVPDLMGSEASERASRVHEYWQSEKHIRFASVRAPLTENMALALVKKEGTWTADWLVVPGKFAYLAAALLEHYGYRAFEKPIGGGDLEIRVQTREEPTPLFSHILPRNLLRVANEIPKYEEGYINCLLSSTPREEVFDKLLEDRALLTRAFFDLGGFSFDLRDPLQREFLQYAVQQWERYAAEESPAFWRKPDPLFLTSRPNMRQRGTKNFDMPVKSYDGVPQVHLQEMENDPRQTPHRGTDARRLYRALNSYAVQMPNTICLKHFRALLA